MSRTEWQAALAMPVSQDRDHIRGRADAPVTLILYGDYECPYWVPRIPSSKMFRPE
jgi:protein-disulfide isomerase